MPALFTCDLKYKMAKTRIKEIFAGSVYTIVIWFLLEIEIADIDTADVITKVKQIIKYTMKNTS